MGIMDEMITEMVDGAMDNPDLEEEADEEVTKVLDEVLAGKSLPILLSLSHPHPLGKVRQLPTLTPAAKIPVPIVEPDEFERRLQELKE